ncbi:MAG: response regulator transcription factor [Desulfobulbaceae bacterium]|nr:response regulator transcription factor [Desulfobulbaceae bacterium]
MNSISILVVADNSADITRIREALTNIPGYAYALEIAGTLAAALLRLAGGHINVVLLDLSLPDSHGMDTLRILIGKYPRVAVIVIAGRKDEQGALQAVRYGAQDCLGKRQLSPAVLHRSIIASLERKKFIREKENLLADLALSLERIEMLQGMLPVCPCCKKIQAEDKNWYLADEYAKIPGRHKVMHDVCPECMYEFQGRKIFS